MATNDTASTRITGRLPRRLGLRGVLIVMVLIPTAGMATLALIGADQAADRRAAAQQLRGDTEAMLGISEARAAVADEEVASSVLTVAGEAGAGPEALEDLYGVDFVADLDDARRLVDDLDLLRTHPDLAEPLRALRAARAGVDAGTIPFEELTVLVQDLTSAIDDVWEDQLNQRAPQQIRAGLPAESRVRIDGLVVAYEALSAGSDLATIAVSMAVQGATRGDLRDALSAETRYQTATDRFERLLGPAGLAAWHDHRGADSTAQFEETLSAVVSGALAQAPSPYSDDLTAFGDAFIDGAEWGDGLTGVVRGATNDLDELSRQTLSHANRELWLMRGGTLVLALVSLAGAMLVARWVIRPVESLEVAAQRIYRGQFEIDPVDPQGPRELGDTARAFNDMASTLAAVEGHAVALADDPDAPILSEQLPGRTGRALQVALNRLRSSVQLAEEHRKELKRAATHDDLTGLLNRAAAMEILERDLSRRRRGGQAVAALFVDLDGLKAINDRHGHGAGDDALRLTAEAIAGAIRATDVGARLGGDEFIVTAPVHDVPDEVQALAERIHQRILDQQLVLPNATIGIRSSIGIAMADDSDDAATLISKADDAMYRAKRAGKNRIAWYDEPAGSLTGRDDPAQPSP